MTIKVNDFLAMLRQSDPWRYPSLLFLPKELRHKLAIIYAFNGEINRIPYLTREIAAGALRLEWWMEVFERKRDGEAGGNPLARALLDLIESENLPNEQFFRFLEIRQSQFFESGALPMAELETQFDQNEGFLFEIAMQLAGYEADMIDETRQTAICYGGRAYGLVQLFKIQPLLRARSQVFMPRELYEAAGLDDEGWLGAPDERHGNIITMLVAQAYEKLQLALHAYDDLPKQERLLFLSLTILPKALEAIEQAGIELLNRTSDISPLVIQWQYWKAILRGSV